MRRVLSFVGLLIVMLGFAVTSQGILRVTMLELRLQIMRDQLLNYELSSRMLKARFKQMSRKQGDDIGTEMKMKVLESGVLNSRQEASTMKLDVMEQLGLWTVNVIRRISLKSTLSLEEDQGKLILLEYAFFQERQRNFDQAAKAYAELETRLKSESGDNQAFALLHYGYCLALIGELEQAKQRLVTVRDVYKGSHYAENASLLLAMMSAGEEKDKEIQNLYKDDRDKARAYYEAGQFSMAVRTFDSLAQLNNRETFMHGRSLEETGQKDRAVVKFTELANKGADPELQKQANRRLLMIGNFYGGGKAVAEQAEKKAAEIGDKETVAQVKETVVLAEKPNVIDKLRDDPGLAQRTAGLEKMRADLEAEVKKQDEAERPTPVAERKAEVVIPPPVIKPKAIILSLVDGRSMRGTALKRSGKVFEVVREGFPVSVPGTMISAIVPEEQKGIQYTDRNLVFVLKDGTQKRGHSFTRTSEKSTVASNDEQIPLAVEDIAEVKLP